MIKVLMFVYVVGQSVGATCADRLEFPAFNYPWMSSVVTKNSQSDEFVAKGIALVRQTDSNFAKLNTVVKYVHENLKWDRAWAEYPDPTYALVLARGRGGCEHFTVLTAALLKTLNLPFRFVVITPDREPGHAWLEVNDGDKTYIVDPTFEFVESLKQSNRSSPLKFAAKSWYLNPKRVYFDAQ